VATGLALWLLIGTLSGTLQAADAQSEDIAALLDFVTQDRRTAPTETAAGLGDLRIKQVDITKIIEQLKENNEQLLKEKMPDAGRLIHLIDLARKLFASKISDVGGDQSKLSPAELTRIVQLVKQVLSIKPEPTPPVTGSRILQESKEEIETQLKELNDKLVKAGESAETRRKQLTDEAKRRYANAIKDTKGDPEKLNQAEKDEITASVEKLVSSEEGTRPPRPTKVRLPEDRRSDVYQQLFDENQRLKREGDPESSRRLSLTALALKLYAFEVTKVNASVARNPDNLTKDEKDEVNQLVAKAIKEEEPTPIELADNVDLSDRVKQEILLQLQEENQRLIAQNVVESERRARLLDFGMARAIQAAGGSNSTIAGSISALVEKALRGGPPLHEGGQPTRKIIYIIVQPGTTGPVMVQPTVSLIPIVPVYQRHCLFR
jgi:hypothetical protein